MCADGQFFEYNTQQCRECNGSCLGSCNYQLSCFQCPVNQYYNIETAICVDTCPSGMLPLENAQMHNLKVWVSMNIYIDPLSESVIELGTK